MTAITPVLGIKRINLQNVTFSVTTAAGAISMFNATNLSIAWKIAKKDATAGASTVVQRVLTRNDAEIKVEGWNSDQVSALDLTPGKQISAVTLSDDEDTPVTMLVDWSNFLTLFPVTGWCFGDTDMKFANDDPSKWTTEIIPNVIAGGIA